MMRIKLFITLLMSIVFVTIISCTKDKDFEDISDFSAKKGKGKIPSGILMELSYDVSTYEDFNATASRVTELDLAEMNPRSEKQHVEMKLLKDGQMHLVIEELDFKNKIKINHKILPDDSPKITKTEILGNIINFYDKNGAMISSTKVDLPVDQDMIKSVKNLEKVLRDKDPQTAFAAMQGQEFSNKIQDAVKNGSLSGVTVQEHGNGYLTARIPQKSMGYDSNEQNVFLIDKKLNKIVASRKYDEKNELIESTYFSYAKDKNHYLRAVKKIERIKLSSGEKVNKTIDKKFDNFKVKFN